MVDEPAQLLRLLGRSRIPLVAAGAHSEMLVDPKARNGFSLPINSGR